MPLQGNNQSLSLPDLFQMIANLGSSGLLVIADRARDRGFHFSRGRLTGIVVNEPGETLSSVLAREFAIPETELADIAATQDSDEEFGRYLLDSDLVCRKELARVVERRVRRAVRETLRWRDWAFHFVELPPIPDPLVVVDTRSIVLDLSREIDEWNRVSEIFFDLDRIPIRIAGSMHHRQFKSWDTRLPAPGKLLLEIDGHRTVRQILEESEYPIYAVAAAISQFVELSFVELADNEINPIPDTITVLRTWVPNLLETTLRKALSKGKFDGPALRMIVARDPALTLKLLRLETSTGLDGALEFGARLNTEGVATHVLGEAVRSTFVVERIPVGRRVWARAFLTSQAAEQLASTGTEVDAELARIAGLVHDLGKASLAASDPEAYGQIEGDPSLDESRRMELESDHFGMDHCRTGLQLAEAWNLPRVLRSVIREHHSALEHPRNPLLAIVRLAVAIAESAGRPVKVDRRLRKALRTSGIAVEDFVQISNELAPIVRTLDALGTESAWSRSLATA